jgi:hypothetical protein
MKVYCSESILRNNLYSVVSSHSNSLRSRAAAPWVPRRSIYFLDHNRFFRVSSSSSSSIIVGIILLTQSLNTFVNLRRALLLLMLLRLENATNELTRCNSHMHADALLGQDSWSAEQHNECLGWILGRRKLRLSGEWLRSVSYEIQLIYNVKLNGKIIMYAK